MKQKYHKWTAEEIDFLVHNYKIAPWDVLSKSLSSHSKTAITHKAFRLGLLRYPKHIIKRVNESAALP